MALQYVKICLTNKYRKLINVTVSCFQVYGKASRGLLKYGCNCEGHTHTTAWLVKNYSQRILTYCMRILLLAVKYV